MGYAASLVAPELPEMGPRYPDWIFLATRAYISDSKNATVAYSHTSDGHPIQVSLFAANPPAVSHLRVHCPGREHQISYNPAVIFSRDDLILFDVRFGGRDMSDYFIYKADSKAPSLVRIADPEPYMSGFCNTGIVCCSCSADRFAVAALIGDYMTDMYKLSVFDSKTGVWETRLLPLEPSEALCNPTALGFFPNKVIPLKGSLLGWVDLWRGILLCDVFSNDPKLHYIPMPKPMLGNKEAEDDGEATYFRDVTGGGELITFAEMVYKDNNDDDEEEEEEEEEDDDDDDTALTNASIFTPDKWTIVTRSRKLGSREWERVHKVRVEDITVSEDLYGCADVLPELCENGIPSLKKMPIGIPTLCECNDVVYFMCKLTPRDTKGWVVGIDLNSKRMEAVSKFSAASLRGFSTAYYPSSFSKYLNDNSAEIELNAQTSDCLASTDTEDSTIDD